MKSTTGSTITERQNITFAEDISEEELKLMSEAPDVQRDALNALKQLYSTNNLSSLLSATNE